MLFALVACVTLVSLSITLPTWAATIHVANNGVDSPACGTQKKNPCRSISQGITNAAVGARILVGPGFYGDLDGSADSDESCMRYPL